MIILFLYPPSSMPFNTNVLQIFVHYCFLGVNIGRKKLSKS